MNTDFPEYKANLREVTLIADLREVTLIVDDENFEALQALADNANPESTFDFLRIEVI